METRKRVLGQEHLDTLTSMNSLAFTWVRAVAFSPDGRQIASGSWDHTIKLKDLTIGEVETTLTGHSIGVKVVTISPDG